MNIHKRKSNCIEENASFIFNQDKQFQYKVSRLSALKSPVSFHCNSAKQHVNSFFQTKFPQQYERLPSLHVSAVQPDSAVRLNVHQDYKNQALQTKSFSNFQQSYESQQQLPCIYQWTTPVLLPSLKPQNYPCSQITNCNQNNLIFTPNISVNAGSTTIEENSKMDQQLAKFPQCRDCSLNNNLSASNITSYALMRLARNYNKRKLAKQSQIIQHCEKSSEKQILYPWQHSQIPHELHPSIEYSNNNYTGSKTEYFFDNNSTFNLAPIERNGTSSIDIISNTKLTFDSCIPHLPNCRDLFRN
ncbi:hypothetical protein GJ496_009513 [Pomphorhynchus laevis]|nr:hypothetical protein GJ496_009513 [Pomphorhynchus laevis]